jgi:hypothetical protein
MSGSYDPLAGLRDGAQQLIGSNAIALAQAPAASSGAQPSDPNPARQWWNFPAKVDAGRRIAAEELEKYRTHNDVGDAMRHAEWSQRMATNIGPIFSRLAGIEHEGQNIADSVGQNVGKRIDPGAYAGRPVASVGQTIAESAMDLRNNAAGLNAAKAGRAIDPTTLQVAPGAPPY